MAIVKISPDFFINEIKNYSDWESAFWRELFQNSIDAGSSEIDIQIQKINESCIVSFSDNGNGMTLNTLENVFFNLGETTKNSADTIGGFGRARIILCFAQTDYLIHTNNLFVNGNGSFYEIQETDTFQKGCKFTITVPLKKFNSCLEIFENKLINYLQMSQFSAKINYKLSDSKEYKIFDNFLPKRGKSKNLSFGNAYANKNGLYKNKIIFRVNGVMMFTKYTSCPIQVIVEIDPSFSRSVLLSNRDGVNWAYSDEVDQFCLSISNDTISAFKDNYLETREIYGKNRIFIPKSANIKAIQPIEFHDSYEEKPFYSYEQVNANSYINNQDYDDQGMIILTQTFNSKLKRASREFSDALAKKDHSKRYKIFEKWIIACEAALDAYCELTNATNIDWIPGLIFNDSLEACHQKINNSHAIMLNPVYISENNFSKIKYNINDFKSNVELLTLASHEVAHCSYRYHDESFANIFTHIVSKVMGNIKELNKLMNS